MRILGCHSLPSKEGYGGGPLIGRLDGSSWLDEQNFVCAELSATLTDKSQVQRRMSIQSHSVPENCPPAAAVTGGKAIARALFKGRTKQK